MTPEQHLEMLRGRLNDAKLRHACATNPNSKERWRCEVVELKRQIAQLEQSRDRK